MFDQILGLPAHPLIIHFAVVLTPLLAVVAVAYALLPARRPLLAWALVLLSVAAPGAVFAAKESGERLREARFAAAGGALGERIETHESFAVPLLLSVSALALGSLVLVYATTSARGSTRDRFGHVATRGLSALVVVLAAVTAYFCFRAGDSGARAVWSS
ncbi:hypothetical protein GCM10010149_77200 [Nonomuraea roseoviolacea subsp. roseoviolacea]|uniref:Membrane protein n=1 Tax=Nonomuraea roseoviolacea subsp. carminata TaxID=160689 RepID=A0ABT1K9R5_9ACTN|nr:DUF2231 domain-containing protein [Nonomuraea roseoviolacea]MCP2350730.1 putative membrane protein [Nonomuraea roseoviolacea subsp. carminata]